MLVHEFLSESARRAPDAIAVIDHARVISYGELDRLTNRVANVLRASGVARHDRVAMTLDNSIEFVAAYFGVQRAGAVAVPLPAGPRSDRLDRATESCTPSACIVDGATAERFVSGAQAARLERVFVWNAGAAPIPSGARSMAAAIDSASDRPPQVRGIDTDLAALIYTSGSTGEPRGVMLTHRNIVANTRSIVQYLELSAADRVMCVLPFYYVYGLSLLHTHLLVGGSVVIENRFAFPNVVIDGMLKHAVTGFAGVPSTFTLLLERSMLPTTSLPALRYVTQAGGGMAPSRVLDWLERGPKVPFFVMYGATEASARLTCLPPAELHRKLGSIGRPIPNVEIVVMTDDGRRASPGESGELVARGSNIACGYWNNPEETAERFTPGGYRTGDLGYQDDEGFLYLVGRRHDMIKVGAHRVGAKEIEDVLHTHSEVLEAAVLGVDHDILGEAPVAFVALRQPSAVGTEALLAFCKARLASHKVPVRIVLRDELPKIAGVGKIDKLALRRLAPSLSASPASI